MWNALNGLFAWFGQDISIDLGTANTLVYVRGKGVVIDEPSVVAVDRQNRNGVPLAIGLEAKLMVGRTPANIVVERPLRDGVISNFYATEAMLRYFIEKVQRLQNPFAQMLPQFMVRPRVVVGIPSGVTEVEKKAVREAALSAGAREVYLIEEPMAAALGAGLPVTEPYGSMIVDIGGGTTEVAVLCLGGIVTARSLRVAGDEMDRAIINYVRQRYNLLIGERSAEEVKMAAGSAFPLPEEREAVIKGRDLVTGLPKSVVISSIELREALAPVVGEIVEAVISTIEATPPELVADLMETGIVLAGGGALLEGLDRRIAYETRFPTYVAEDPLTCVARGAGEILEDLPRYRRVLVRSETRKIPRA